MKKRNYRSYNAFLKKAQKENKLSYKEARKVYSVMRKRFYRPLKAVDLDRHPRITRESIFQATGGKTESYNRQTNIQEYIDAVGSKGLSTLFDRHYEEEGYEFSIENDIVKVSISTTKTRKKFSVRS